MSIAAGRLVAIWIAWGSLLLGIEIVAWAWDAQVQGWLLELQRAYGTSEPAPWALRSDTHLHLLVSIFATTWIGLGCRLFAPRAIIWLPVAGMVLIALADEIAQLGAAARHFEWNDQFSDAVGITVGALINLSWLRHLQVRRTGVHRAAASSRATSARE